VTYYVMGFAPAAGRYLFYSLVLLVFYTVTTVRYLQVTQLQNTFQILFEKFHGLQISGSLASF
jgi:hypothetical protein